MKKVSALLFVSLFSLLVLAQQTDVKKLVQEGIQLHDKGDYEGAIKKYDEALRVDKDNFDAAYEKSLSYMYLKRHEDCIAISKSLVEKFSGRSSLHQVYSNWASALDDAGKPEEAIKIFDRGIALFPDHSLLHFNKGLTLMRMKKFAEAIPCYQAALKRNPLHPSSHYQLGMLLRYENRIASLLSLLLFIACEPQTDRSKKAYEAVQENVYRNVSKDGNKTTISISMDLVEKKQKGGSDDFSNVELVFSMLGATDNSAGIDSIAQTPPEKFDFKLQMLINALANGKKENTGFYWEHCVPFFVELRDKQYTSALSNLLYLSKDIGAQLWIEKNKEKVGEFYEWLQKRTW